MSHNRIVFILEGHRPAHPGLHQQVKGARKLVPPNDQRTGDRHEAMTNEPMTNEQLASDKQELINLTEAAERYGFSTAYLRQLARKGRLKAKKVGRDWVTTWADVEEYIRSRERRGAYREDIEA